MILLFDITKIPRTISREKWKELWRWKRVTLNDLAQMNEQKHKLLGTDIPDKIKLDIVDQLTNPPVLLGPYQ